MRYQGFILILVLGLLGILSFVGITLLKNSVSNAELMENSLIRTHLQVTLRSSVEKGVIEIDNFMTQGFVDSLDKIAPFKGSPYHKNLTPYTSFVVQSKDASACINVNDGVIAGRLEHAHDPMPGGYQANQLDPWPGGIENRSGLINLRIRRLLNCYGDVWKFKADLGTLPTMTSDNGTFAKSFEFSSSAAGDVGVSQPAGSGLGDLIINNRPQSGYHSFGSLKGLINNWGRTHLLSVDPTFLDDEPFFKLIQNDLALSNFEDTDFFRMKREFGSYENNFTVAETPLQSTQMNPPNLSNLWQPHSVSLINLNAASNEVRSAVFYAPTNVRYSCEHILAESVTSITAFNQVPWINTTQTLGISGPMFDLNSIKENGYPAISYIDYADLKDNYSTLVQKNRLMSMRDAMVLASSYELFGVHSVTGYPDSFTSFASMLRQLRDGSFDVGGVTKPLYERCLTTVHSPFRYPIKDANYFFNQTYVERTLPHILSAVRRLPSWMGAPVALLSPYLHPDPVLFEMSPQYRPLRKVEDFVKTHHIPKVCFLPTGQFVISAEAAYRLSEDQIISGDMVVTYKAFHTQIFRTQDKFLKMKEPSSPIIQLGPELSSSSTQLGTIGLKDKIELSGPQRPYSAWMEFDLPNDPLNAGSLGSVGNWVPIDSAASPYVQEVLDLSYPYSSPPGVSRTYDFTRLQDSFLEGGANSLFTHDSSSADVSPFGGILFSSRDHGPRCPDTQKIFSDSLFFNPEDFIVDQNKTTGQVFSKGMVSFWFRLPTGVHYGHHVLFHLNLFERVELEPVHYEIASFSEGFIQEVDPLIVNESEAAEITDAIFESGEEANIPSFEVERIGNSWAPPQEIFPGIGAHQILSSSANNPAARVRPVNITVYYDAFERKVYAIHDSYRVGQSLFRADFHQNYVNNDLTQYINGIDPASAFDSNTVYDYLGVPGEKTLSYIQMLGRDVDKRLYVREWFEPGISQGVTIPSRHKRIKIDKQYHPGAWNRIVVGWNYSTVQFSRTQRFWMFDGLGHYAVEVAPPMTPTEGFASGFAHNPKMLATVGEMPFFNATTVNLTNNHLLATLSPLEQSSFLPLMRANTLIDDFDFRFGSVDTTWLGYASSQDSFIYSQKLALDPFTRYDVSSTPTLTLNPLNLDSKWKEGSEVLAIGARIYDVPVALTDPGVIVPKASAVSLELLDSTLPTVQYQSPDNTVGDLFQQFSLYANSHSSKAVTTFLNWPISSATRLQLKFQNTAPDGTAVVQMFDSPWVQEISYRIKIKPSFVKWDNF